jgi:hypothetical protein
MHGPLSIKAPIIGLSSIVEVEAIDTTAHSPKGSPRAPWLMVWEK